MPMVVAGRPHHPGGPGDGSTFSKFNRPDGLALDVIGQRRKKHFGVVNLITETMTAAVRFNFQHESGHLGPALHCRNTTGFPGFIVESIWHNPLIDGPPQFGNYFYFQSSKGYASGDLKDWNVFKSIKPQRFHNAKHLELRSQNCPLRHFMQQTHYRFHVILLVGGFGTLRPCESNAERYGHWA